MADSIRVIKFSSKWRDCGRLEPQTHHIQHTQNKNKL